MKITKEDYKILKSFSDRAIAIETIERLEQLGYTDEQIAEIVAAFN